jgi:hypothetical protein
LDLRLFIFRISEFQNFSVSEFQNFSVSAFTPRGGTNIGTGRRFPKKVSVPAYPAFACAVKARKMRRFKVQVGIRQKTWRQKKLEKREKRGKSYWLEVIGGEEREHRTLNIQH